MLDKIKLTNFRQHKSTVIELVPGVNTIVGANNSGKSTIPEAIEFALYGARGLRDTAKGFITDGEQDGAAVIALTVAGHRYQVGRNSKNAKVYKDTELDAQYKDNVSAYVAQITGVNQTGFRLGHYVRQKELAAFSSLRPGKRHETVEKMLKVNAVDKAIAKIKAEVTELEITQRTLLSAYRDIEALENQRDDCDLVLSSLTKKERDLKQDLTFLTKHLSQQRELQLKLAQKQQLASLDKQISDCRRAETAILALQQEMKALGEVSESRYLSLKEQFDSLARTELLAAKMATIASELEKLTLVKPEEVVEPLRPNEVPVIEAEALLKQKRAALEAYLRVKAGSECSQCHQQITAEIHLEITTKLSDECKPLEDVALKLRERFTAAFKIYLEEVQEYKSYLAGLERFNQAEMRKAELLANYVELDFDPKAKQSLELELTSLRKAKEAWQEKKGELQQVQKIADSLQGLLTRREALAYLEGYKDCPELEDNIRKNEQNEAQLNRDLNTCASELAYTKGRILELERTISQMESAKESIERTALEIASKKLMQDNFVLFKRYLTSKIRPLLEQVAETLFHKTTLNRYAAFNLSSDYEISLTTHRGYVRKLATISGSENDLACLCLRLAIATLRSTKLAGSLGFIILDEISGSFDDQRTKQTLEGLLELRDVIPQIINITHKPVEMKYADRLFTVKEVNGVSSVTW